MKLSRLLLIGCAVAVAVVVAIVVLAFTPAFQTWVVHRTLAAHPEIPVSVGRVSLGWQRVRLENLRWARGGLVATVPSLEAELSLWNAVRQKVALQRLVARGWTLDLTPATPAAKPPASGIGSVATAGAGSPPAAAPAPFPGLFALLKLPVDLTVEAVELEGNVVFTAAPGQPSGRAQVTLTGGQLGAGREGKFDFAAAAALAPTVPVNALQARGTLTVAMDTPRSFTRFALHTDAEARGAQFPQGARLSLAASVARAVSAEEFTLQIEMVGKRLLYVQATRPVTGGRFSGVWKLDARDNDVVPFALGHALPTFVAAGEGRFVADATLAEFQFDGRLDATVDKLAIVRPELGTLGALRVIADFNVSQLGGATRIDRLTATIDGPRPVLALEALQGFEFHATTGELKVADPTKDLVHLSLLGVPLAWAQPFCPAFTVTGTDLRGELVASARDGGFAIRAQTPLTVGELSVRQGDRPLARAIDLSLSLGADYSPQGWQAEIADLTARSGGARLFTLTARAGRLVGADQPVKARGQWQADLPALLAQPAATGFVSLAGGNATGEFVASLDSKKEIQVKMALRELVAAATKQPLPSLAAEARLDLAPDGTITLQAPFAVENTAPERTSDFKLAGTLRTGAAGLALDGSLTSQSIAVEDLQLLATALAPAAAPASTKPTAAPGLADSAPFWHGISGQVTLALKQVGYRDQLTASDVSGTVKISNGTLAFDGVRALFDQGSDCKIDGGVTFDAKTSEPYRLAADLTVNNFASAALFRHVRSAVTPSIDAKFELKSQLAGTGADLTSLAERTSGAFQVNSKGGTFRLLRADIAGKVQKNQSTTTSTIGGLLSAVTGSEKMADLANRAQNVNEIARDLAEIPFDQLNFTLVRDLQRNLQVQDFALISPKVRLNGSGEIHFQANTDLANQPLDLRLQLSVRGRLADLMSRVSLLDGRQDDLGYTGFVAPFQLGGTLAEPDTSALATTLVKAASGSLINSLLGK
jgi:hypothetical protein